MAARTHAEVLLGGLGAYAMLSRHDPYESTKAARAAFVSKLERDVDPDGVLPLEERLRRAEMARKGALHPAGAGKRAGPAEARGAVGAAPVAMRGGSVARKGATEPCSPRSRARLRPVLDAKTLYLTTTQAAQRLGVTGGTVRAQIGKGKLSAAKLGPILVIRTDELARYARENQTRRRGGRRPSTSPPVDRPGRW